MKRINDFQLTRNFNLSEFEDPSTNQVKISAFLVERLQSLRNQVGPLVITSGYRTEKHNKKVGGHAKSAHMFGRAVDVVPGFSSIDDVVETARGMGFSRVIPYEKHIHIAIK